MSKTVPAAIAATEPADAPTPTVPATFLPTPDGTPCEAYPWCAETGAHVDHISRAVSLPVADGLPPILTAHLYTDQAAGLPSLDFDPGYDDWREGITSDQLRAEVTRVRAHLVRLDAFADEYDAITEAGTAGVLHRTAAYVTEQGVTPEQAEALDAVAHAVIEDGDPDGAGRALAEALSAQPGEDAQPAVQLTDAAVSAVEKAVTASLAGLQTNPHDVAARLHEAIDRAQAAHLHGILPSVYTPDTAYSNERFCTAMMAMDDAVKYSRDQALTVTGLRAALDLGLIRDAVPADVLAEYPPAADHEDAETIKTAGASGAILKAYLHTPREIDGTQTGPRVLAVYSEDGADDELDLDGALHLREQVAALLPNLDAMIAVLAADEADRQDGGQQR